MRQRLYLGRDMARVDDRAQCYASLGKNEVKAYDVVITSTIFVCDRIEIVWFYSGCTYSHVSVRYLYHLKMLCDISDAPVRVSTLVGKSFIVTHVYRAFLILFM